MQGYYTTEGLALSAKLLAGTELTISRVVAGSGRTQTTAASLSGPCQTLAVNTPSYSGDTAVIPATLAAANASGNYTLTELGVYARDPDKGEILYKVYRLSEPIKIVAGSKMVLRFYLEETVSQNMNVTVVCSPAGLITEADIASVRTTGAASESVLLNASELQAYLDRLPRLLTKCITIRVSGTLDADLTISGFYGCGAISLHGTDGFTVNGRVRISDCGLSVELFDIAFQAPENLSKNVELLTLKHCSKVWVDGCSFTGNDVCAGIAARHCTEAVLTKCAMSHFGIAVEATVSSIISVIDSTASSFSDNTSGAYTYCGGIILLDATIPDLLGGVSNVKSGGPIFKYDGSLL